MSSKRRMHRESGNRSIVLKIQKKYVERKLERSKHKMERSFRGIKGKKSLQMLAIREVKYQSSTDWRRKAIRMPGHAA